MSNGITIKMDACKNAMILVIASLLKVIKDRYVDFYSEGQVVITKFVAGIRFKEASATAAMSLIVANCASSIRNKYSDFQNAGAYLVDGFANGISENTFKAAAAAAAMAKAAADAAKKQLDEHSPSKVGYQIGDFFGMPFVQAIENYADKAYEAGAHVSEQAKAGMSNAIAGIKDFLDGNIDSEPTIRPVLDLSNVKAGTLKLNALFSRKSAASISVETNQRNSDETQKAENGSLGGNSIYNLTQINNSPKALSRLEIYRQTNNLFSRLQEVKK